MALCRQPALTILAPVDDILQTLSLPRLGDFRPVEVFAGFGVVDDVRHSAGRDLTLAAGRCARVQVRRRVDVLLALVEARSEVRGGLGERGEVGLEVGNLSHGRCLVVLGKVGFSGRLILLVVEEAVVPGRETLVTLVKEAAIGAKCL